MGLEPHECIVVGDDIESDIRGAIDAGIKAVLVKTGKASGYKEQKNKEFIPIENFSKLKDFYRAKGYSLMKINAVSYDSSSNMLSINICFFMLFFISLFYFIFRNIQVLIKKIS